MNNITSNRLYRELECHEIIYRNLLTEHNQLKESYQGIMGSYSALLSCKTDISNQLTLLQNQYDQFKSDVYRQKESYEHLMQIQQLEIERLLDELQKHTLKKEIISNSCLFDPINHLTEKAEENDKLLTFQNRGMLNKWLEEVASIKLTIETNHKKEIE